MCAHQHHPYSLDNQFVLLFFLVVCLENFGYCLLFSISFAMNNFKFDFRKFPCAWNLFKVPMQSIDIVFCCAFWIIHCPNWIDMKFPTLIASTPKFEDIFKWLRCALCALRHQFKHKITQNCVDDRNAEWPIVFTHANQMMIGHWCVSTGQRKFVPDQSWATLNWTELSGGLFY